MSFDGSFSPSASLRRLLKRCPSLCSDPALSSFHQNCDTSSFLVLDDLVEALADPFLHPEYTIPIVGCLRPICERIATRAVEKLRAAHTLNSENDTNIEDEIGEGARVIDFYLSRGAGLRFPEVACMPSASPCAFFVEFLQQPVIAFLNKQVMEAGYKSPSWLNQKEPEKIHDELPQFPVYLVKLRYAERFLWYEWQSKAESIFLSMGECLLLKEDGLMQFDLYAF